MDKIEEIAESIKTQVLQSRAIAERNGNPLSCGVFILDYYLENALGIDDSETYGGVRKALIGYF